jgi:hypothetical protein
MSRLGVDALRDVLGGMVPEQLGQSGSSARIKSRRTARRSRPSAVGEFVVGVHRHEGRHMHNFDKSVAPGGAYNVRVPFVPGRFLDPDDEGLDGD